MRLRFASFLAGLVALFVLTVAPSAARAQSETAIANARQLALAGIKKYNEHDYAAALAKLQEAEKLYDAPIHVIYIARCQAALGQYVEATENYNKLVRLQLEKDAPDAFKKAVADAKKELSTVESKRAAVTISVTPSGIDGLKIQIDGVDVPSAMVGVERPTDPGTRKLTVSAPGYKESEQTLELKPGDSKPVSVTLERDESTPLPPPGGEKVTTANKGGGDKGTAAEPAAEQKLSPIGFLIGLRVGGGLMGGQISKDQAMSDYLSSAGVLELRAGVRVLQHYTLLLFGSGTGYQAGAALKRLPGSQSRADTKPFGTDAGVGVMWSTEPGKLGPFAEADLLFVHRFDITRDLTINQTLPLVPVAERCTQTLKAFGGGLRLGGGVQIPLASFFQLSPYGAVTFGQVSDVSTDDPCKNQNAGLDGTPWDQTKGKTFGSDQRATHFMITLGVGGDLLIGSDKPKK